MAELNDITKGNFTPIKDPTTVCHLIAMYHSLKGPAYFPQLLLWLSIFDGILAVVGVFSNGVLLVTIWFTPRLHSPSITLLFCLACTDLLNGILSLPLVVAYQLLERANKMDWSCTIGTAMESSAWTASGLSVAFLAVIAVERLLALKLHLRYITVVTNSRVLVVVAILLLYFTSIMILRLLGVAQRTYNIISIFTICLFILIISVSYSKIYKIVRHHQRAVISQLCITKNNSFTNTVGNRSDFSKAVKTAIDFFYVLGFFVVSYVPFVCILVASLITEFSPALKSAYYCSATAIFANSTLNPYLYCWKMRDVRKAVLKILRNKTL